jgi:hypothetical protein
VGFPYSDVKSIYPLWLDASGHGKALPSCTEGLEARAPEMPDVGAPVRAVPDGQSARTRSPNRPGPSVCRQVIGGLRRVGLSGGPGSLCRSPPARLSPPYPARHSVEPSGRCLACVTPSFSRHRSGVLPVPPRSISTRAPVRSAGGKSHPPGAVGFRILRGSVTRDRSIRKVLSHGAG